MIVPLREDVNQAAFRKLKPTIDASYPAGHFIAIDEGQIVADAASFDAIDAALNAMGKTSQEILVVQAGEDYPDFGWIITMRPTP